ncbi:ribosome silencing factor [Gallaecimonas kandeliae]|uniref:ribosome silencing factor n=1 Tax=Gallaecimonas kandeliae TaxID=3029055 RepID=UPI002649590F|nr:ribosome silencing factor [Gallaecimonas kandeliae]WKE66629.1 ribosome silencing factor [Gallaecimonas kandeliae]
MNGEQLKDFVVDKADDLKAVDIKALDVRGKSSVTEFLVVCSGTSRTHVNAIAENVVTEAKHAGLQPLGIEGKAGGEWVLVDLGDVVLHVMQEQTRDFYQLEKLWS